MRKWLAAGAVVLLVACGLLWLQSGPRGPVPTVDPIVRWNAEHADLADNAADLYRAAFERLVGKEDPAWCENCDGTTDLFPPEAAAWVEQNQAALDLLRQATERANCWFTLERSADGDVLLRHLGQMRTLAKLLRWRALIAAQEHDAATLAESAVTSASMAHHADQGPAELMTALVAIAIRALPLDVVPQPMLWPELTAADRAAYLVRLAPIFDPPAALTEVLGGEQELTVWKYLTTTPPSIRRTFLAAPDRVAGELTRYYQPLRDLAAVPVERQCDPADPLAAQVQALEDESPPRSNIPRLFAQFVSHSASRPLTIRARLITQQRGARTVLELFAYRDRTGALPETLDALEGDFKIDPFSGQPFVYRRTADGFTLYSVGIDRKDDGGRHDPKFGEGKSGGDFVFWPIPERDATSATSQP